MRRVCIFLFALLPFIGLAAGVNLVTIHVKDFIGSGVGTNTTAKTASQKGVTGKVLEWSIDVNYTASVSVVTTSNRGSSLVGAKTISAMADITNGSEVIQVPASGTNFFLYNDEVVVSVTNSLDLTDDEDVKVILLLEK